MKELPINGNQDISISIYKKRWLKFKTMKRGYYSFIIIITLYIFSFLLPLLINSRALIVNYNGKYYFPAVLDLLPGVSPYYPGQKFDQQVPGEADYRKLRLTWNEGNSQKKLTNLYMQRKNIYKLANHKIVCDKLHKKDVVKKITAIYEKY